MPAPIIDQTLGDLKTRVAKDLRRSNIAEEIEEAIIGAIRDHDSERFWFNESETYLLTLTPGVDEYTLSPQSPIQEFIRIDMIRAQQGPGTGPWYTVGNGDGNGADTHDDIEEMYSNPSSGQPARFASHDGTVIRFWPTPNLAYPIKIFGHYRIVPLIDDQDSNSWTNEARNLIRFTALKRLFTFPIRDQNQMQSADMAGNVELEYLRRETSRRMRRGRMQPYYG